MYFPEKLWGKGLYEVAWNIDSQQMLPELPPILHLKQQQTYLHVFLILNSHLFTPVFLITNKLEGSWGV